MTGKAAIPELSGSQALASAEGPKKPVVVLAGPTASGKSTLALALAQEFGGLVINADSMQIYRDLRILTARPSIEDCQKVPHKLYGILDSADPCSVGRWLTMAGQEIAAAHGAGRLPIVVGGTGLYLKALMEGISSIPDVPGPTREKATQLYDSLGGAAFKDRLVKRDPQTAERLPPTDRQRLIRAWEVVEATGRPLSDWHQAAGEGAPVGCDFIKCALLPPRPTLYAACDRRFGEMIERGALAEVEALLARNLDPALPVMKSLGVPELALHLAGEVALPQAVTKAQQKTRNYAKRQITWLRHQFIGNDNASLVEFEQFSERLRTIFFNKIRQRLLTS
ncbi:MAG: tRNA (adenosine(37)-N6)-dimethylallyltransferase MiaA [Pseudomonadota bacterium]